MSEPELSHHFLWFLCQSSMLNNVQFWEDLRYLKPLRKSTCPRLGWIRPAKVVVVEIGTSHNWATQFSYAKICKVISFPPFGSVLTATVYEKYDDFRLWIKGRGNPLEIAPWRWRHSGRGRFLHGKSAWIGGFSPGDLGGFYQGLMVTRQWSLFVHWGLSLRWSSTSPTWTSLPTSWLSKLLKATADRRNLYESLWICGTDVMMMMMMMMMLMMLMMMMMMMDMQYTQTYRIHIGIYDVACRYGANMDPPLRRDESEE